MIIQETAVFGTDPWWMTLIKVVVLFVVLLVWTIFNVWFERRVVGKMQHRKGPIMNGPFGLAQALGDGLKLLFKEDFMPGMVDKVLFNVAPIIAGTAAFTSWALLPFGGEVTIFGVKTNLQVTDLPVSTLVILSVASVGIYGFVLAGWSSNSPYSLLGGLRSSAQMVSYEVAMGLSLVSVFLYAGSMQTSDIVAAQSQPLLVFGYDIGLQQWYWLLSAPAFIIYVVSMIGETNRAPFDLPECEQELVSGHITEYSGFRYAIYFLAEYINMATVSAIATTLFVGGYHAPWPLSMFAWANLPWLGPVWFIAKVQCFFFGFVWLRGTLPRLRYDQFMNLGWKVLMPAALGWIVLVATVRKLQTLGFLAEGVWWIVLLAFLVLVLVLGYAGFRVARSRRTLVRAVATSTLAGGYPVPPMPGEVLPGLVTVVKAEEKAVS